LRIGRPAKKLGRLKLTNFRSPIQAPRLACERGRLYRWIGSVTTLSNRESAKNNWVMPAQHDAPSPPRTVSFQASKRIAAF
jgi:hypothetical protein